MATQKLFYIDPYQTDFTAQVLRCEPGKHGWDVVLDRTCFYPEGGGQPYDTGVLGGVRVTEVHERGEEIVHSCEGPVEGEVSGRIDWARRFDFMQQHSGEHIVSGIIHGKYGYENVGFHMGAELVTIDVGGELTDDQVREIESLANAYLWANASIEITWPSAEELETLTYRSKKALSGDVRIVRFPEADCCACCGTHVRQAGEVGLVKLLSCQKFREGVRIELVCGKRALDYCSAILAQNTQVSQLLSAKPMATGAAVARMKEENETLNYRIVGLEARVFADTAARYAGAERVLHFEPNLSSDGVRRLAVAIMEQTGGIVAVCSGSDGEGYKYCLGQTDGDLRALTKEWNATLNGRGGGKPFFSQGSVSAAREAIETFWNEKGI